MGMNKEDKKYPLVSIQCDWNDTLMTPGNEVWASYKFKDCPSVHGKVACISSAHGSLIYESSEGFSAKLINQSTLELDLEEIKHRATLLAPTSSHSNVHTKSITCFDVTSKGVIVSAGSDGKLLLWNSDKEGRMFQLQLEGHVGDVYKCMFFPSEKVVLSCGSDMTLRIWCAITGQCPVKLVGHTQPVTDCCIVEKGRNVLSVSKDGSAKLWNCGDAMCLGDIIKVPSIINCCKIHEAPSSMNLGMPNHNLDVKEIGTENKIVVLGCEDGMIYCVGLQTRNLVFSISVESPINCISFISETKFVVGCQNGMLIIYDIMDGAPETLATWHDSNSAVLSILPTTDIDCNFYVSHADGSVILKLSSNPSNSLFLTGSNCDPVYHLAANSRYVFTSCRDSVIRAYDKAAVMKIINHKN